MVLHVAAEAPAADLTVVLVPPAGLASAAWGADVARAAADATTATEPLLVYPATGGRLALVGLGTKPGDAAERRRNAAGRAARAARSFKAQTVALVPPPDADAEALTDFVEGFLLGSYTFLRYKTGEDAAYAGPTTLHLVADTAHTAAAEAAQVRAEATNLARDLINLSPDELTPQVLGQHAVEAAAVVGLHAEVWDKARIEQEGLGGLLGVNRGSLDPPAFIVLEHRPAQAVNAQPLVLVGKAITFDTGGLSLKPTKDSMDKMKADMSGGAAVLGAMVAVARLRLPLHVVALIPSTDNRPGERAYVPGDVLRMHSGLTVEVLNTDAEGRLILADALSIARRYDPELVIDVATLTGAQVIALGSKVAGVMTAETDGAEARLAAMQAAGRRTGDLVAPLPMFEHYAEQLRSDVADLKNIGGPEGGTITAAKFLERFTAYPWLHLDIAGCAFISESLPYRPKGGTGFGVRLLVEFLQQRAAQTA